MYTWERSASITIPGGSRKDYVYDPFMRMQNITTKDPGQNVLMNYEYIRDKIGNITKKQTEHGEYIYDYDDLYRLTNAESPTLDPESYTYNGVDNRLTSADTTGDWTYNQNNVRMGDVVQKFQKYIDTFYRL